MSVHRRQIADPQRVSESEAKKRDAGDPGGQDDGDKGVFDVHGVHQSS